MFTSASGREIFCILMLFYAGFAKKVFYENILVAIYNENERSGKCNYSRLKRCSNDPFLQIIFLIQALA